MISLLRWGFGNGHEHLTDKERITAAEKCNPHAASTMMSTQVKRKRGDSTQSLTAHSPHRPAKRGAPVVNPRGGASTAKGKGKGRGKGAKALIPTLTNEDVAQDSVIAPSNPLTPESDAQHMEVDLHVDAAKVSPPLTPDLAQSAATMPSTAPADAAEPMDSLSDAQSVIAEHFCLEILLKHNELRLIDQEVAKCQVALEQLRRCSVIPYPTSTGASSDMFNVANGMGLPLRPASGNTAPRHPAPWGVTNGPYTRHYSRWLLPDSEFDGGAVEDIPMSARGSKVGSDRRQRPYMLQESSRTATGRGRRGSTGSRLHALPSNYPPTKEDKEKGLAIVTRQSDKKLVKLVCPTCSRENFNSAQGFINHCRIAHGTNFASHEAAAQQVGVEVDAPPADTSASAVAPPSAARTEPATPAPTYNGFVPPLLRPGLQNVPTLVLPMPKRPPRSQRNLNIPEAPITPARQSAPDTHSGVPFNPSSQTPHLSKVFKMSGRGGDLDEFVSEATVKQDPRAVESDGEESSASNFEDSDVPQVMHKVRMPARTSLRGGPASMSPAPSARPHSRKGPERAARRLDPIETPAQNRAQGYARSHPTTLQLADSPPNDLSPHTVESNNAPSLVSDSDDDEYESGNGSSAQSSDNEDEEDEGSIDVDFEVEDVTRERASHVDPGVVPGKGHDPELSTSSTAKVTQRGSYRSRAKNGAPKKRGGR